MSGQILRWRSHPFKRSIKTSILVIGFLILCWFFVYLSTQSTLFLVISVVILLGSLSSFFLPTEYELSNDKIKVRFFFSEKEKDWDFYQSYYADKNGVLLSPFEKPSRLENFRGMYLRFEKNKDEVVDFVKSKMKKGGKS